MVKHITLDGDEAGVKNWNKQIPNQKRKNGITIIAIYAAVARIKSAPFYWNRQMNSKSKAHKAEPAQNTVNIN